MGRLGVDVEVVRSAGMNNSHLMRSLSSEALECIFRGLVAVA